MKRLTLSIVVSVLATISTFAQSSNNVDDVVKIDHHASRQYREGEMIVKFKPSSAVRVQSLKRGVTSGVNGVDKVLDELGITASEQLMPLSGEVVTPRAKALRSVSGKTIEDSDMSQLYRLSFDANKVGVHEAIDKLSALDEVEFAEPNYIVYALSSSESSETFDTAAEAAAYKAEPLYSQQWGIEAINLPQLWAQPKITTERPVIAILDTGVDIEHSDLKDNIWTNEAEQDGAEGEDDDDNGFADDLHGWDFVNQTARIGDWNGHGTHCAGIAAAVGDNGVGITGANPDALIMPITVMQSDGTGDIATIIKGIDYAAANGADVISMSLGGYSYSIAEEQALAKAYNKAVLVAAAGNDQHDMDGHHCPLDAPMFPAAFTFVLGVEASADANGGRAGFSNWDCNGPIFSSFGEEQLYNYELRAPGVNIMSTYPGGKYKSLNGTSMACPLVAGAMSRYMQSREIGNREMLFGDLIHTSNGNIDVFAAYNIKDEDRKPTLWLINYELKDTIDGDGDGRPDAGETMAIYPTFRNDWGQAENIKLSLTVGENEDPEIVEILDSEVQFGKPLSGYAKAKSNNSLRFKINNNCVDGRHIRLVLRATCDNVSEEFVQEFVIVAENGAEIGGVIMEDMILYPNVHYIVTQPLAIPSGMTLTIKPGTVLRFKDNAYIKCEGRLNCSGTPDNMIVFTMATGCSKWNGIEASDHDTIEYVKFCDIPYAFSNDGSSPFNGIFKNIIITNVGTSSRVSGGYTSDFSRWENTRLIKSNLLGYYFDNVQNFIPNPTLKFQSSNIIGSNVADVYGASANYFRGMHTARSCNIYGNYVNGVLWNTTFQSNDISIYRNEAPIYWGSSKEDIVRNGIHDMNSSAIGGFGVVDLSNMLTQPSTETHAIVWKVLVNGKDAQDEFEELPPLGVGKHKFEVYFSRPMDKAFVPTIAMGIRPPYNQTAIAEEGSWNEDGTIYTAYLTITGKMAIDGLNRIFVADAVETCEDYYLRKDLQPLLSKTRNLLEEVSSTLRKVDLQAFDESKDGYCSNSNIASSGSGGLFNDDYFQVDLGINKQTSIIRVKMSCSDAESIEFLASNDGINFDKIQSFYDILNREYTSPLYNLRTSYRYFRFVMHTFSNTNYSRINNFELEVVDCQPKEAYKDVLTGEEAREILEHIATSEYLCIDDNRDLILLQNSLNNIYADYNKLATILDKPTITQTPVYVPSAPEWVIPQEHYRFNVEVAVAGSMSTGLMAEAGLGKVTLTWETDEEDFEDLLGYNIYRYTMDEGVSSDSIIVNPSVIDSEETSFVDYNVEPGTTYYYVIKQLTTSLGSHALSNAVAATPLTAQKGDANGSMSVDIADVVTEVAYITYQDPQPFIFEAADVNNDAKVNVLDVVGTIGIITNPAGIGVSGIDNEPVRYFVKEGVLYVETTQSLGGVQVRLDVDKGTAISALEALTGMEQTSVWTSDSEYLFLAYSMSGRSLAPGTHALLQIGAEAIVTEVVISDTKGKNITAVNGDATGIGKVEAMQLQMPAPNPFTTVLNVPYTIGKSGSHEVTISFCDLAGRTIDAYHTVNTMGEYTYTWYPKALQKGLYLVNLYVDGELMQTVKVIRE